MILSGENVLYHNNPPKIKFLIMVILILVINLLFSGEMWKHPLLKPYILRNAKPTGRVLGAGTYGSVEEVKVRSTVYAGKKFRCDVFPNVEKFCKTFTREYACIHRLQHRHIVQYRGISSLPDSKLPVLLMERLETNLHNYLLNPDHANLDLAVKVSILRGVAKGLIHLHNQTPPIIHRDLTAKNVLLDSSELVAKISDFGNARLFDADPSSELATMSNVPGTLLYMPPEALNDDAKYNTKLDIFSYGHLALFTTTQVFPRSLLPATYYGSGLSGGESQLLGRPEVERRKKYFDMLGDQHPLLSLIVQCLHNKPEERPKATKIETKLDKCRPS